MSTVQRLNEITANLGVLYAKLHQHHFYVKGQDFYKLHELFETQYNEVHEQFDEVAERILMIGGKPVSTLGEFLALATIKEAPYTTEKSARQMVEETVADFELFRTQLEAAIHSDMDEVSQDLLIGMKAVYDKHLWTMKAYLG